MVIMVLIIRGDGYLGQTCFDPLADFSESRAKGHRLNIPSLKKKNLRDYLVVISRRHPRRNIFFLRCLLKLRIS